MIAIPTSLPSLVIEQLMEDDAEEHFALIEKNRDHLGTWLPWVDETRIVRDVACFIAISVAAWPGRRALACALRLEGKIIGGIGIVEWSQLNESLSIGYWLGSEFRGHGFMTFAVQALCKHCFEKLSVQRIEIRAAIANTASRAIPERLGFTLEGTLRRAIKASNTHHDCAVYGLLPGELAAHCAP